MSSRSRHNALEHEIFREQAGALGLAGKQLQAALEAYEKDIAQGGSSGNSRSEKLLNEVAEKVYALLLQREFVGFTHGNVEWLQRSFNLPPKVLSRLGSLPAGGSDA